MTRTPTPSETPCTVDAQVAGGQVFKVEIGVIAAGCEGFGKIRFEIVLRDAKLLAEEGIGKGHLIQG
jgi:hypothetical protein